MIIVYNGFGKDMYDKETFSVLDVETTGFSPKRRDKIIEIGITKISRKGKVLDRLETLVNPNRSVGATHVHGITGEMVVNAPTFGEIAGTFLDFVNDSYLVAHNAPFDIRFVISELNNCGIEINSMPYICTLSLSKRLLPYLPSKKLDRVCDYFGIDIAGYHSAFTDSFATASVFSIFLNRYGMIEQMNRYSEFHIDSLPHTVDRSAFLTRPDLL